ncbi:MAG TPA: 50S ribosome-binding GTPase [bacterium]|nr:50S ribosome-binding GTPase [bacterium]
MRGRSRSMPAHMSAAMRKLEELSGVINLAIQTVDARAPNLTRCDFIIRALPGCSQVTLVTKADLADPKALKEWLAHFEREGIPTLVFPHSNRAPREKFIEKIRRASGAPENVRAAVIGLPNVGKSTVMNYIVGKRSVRVGAQPGITRAVQLVNAGGNFVLVDTPGVVTPQFARREHGLSLALLGCLQDSFFNPDEAALHLLARSLPFYCRIFNEYYDVETETCDPVEFCEAVARRRGMLRKGGKLDLDRVYPLIVQDFSTGRIFGVSLEAPPAAPA